MKSFLFRLFPTWVYWLGLSFTIGGLIYSIGRNMPWIACLALVPLSIASIHTAIQLQTLNCKKQTELDHEIALRRDAEQKLKQISTVVLGRFEDALMRGSFEQVYDTIYTIAAYIGRLQALETTDFNIREFFVSGSILYIAVKLPGEALRQLRPDDPFILHATRSGLNHRAAKLRVHQVNQKESSVFLEVIEELDSSTIASLMGLAATTGIKGLKDFIVSPELNPSAFKEHNMHDVAEALTALRNQLNANLGL